MKVSPSWISSEIQAQIEPPPIPIVKNEPVEVNKYDIIKINMHWNPYSTESETYELKIVTFDHGQPEEFPKLTKNSKRAVDRAGATKTAGKINYLRTILRGEALL